MNPRRKKRLTIILAILIGLGSVAGLVLYALSQNIDLFYKPTEIYLGKEDTGAVPVTGQRIRIGGIVVPGSVKRDENSLKVSFQLADMSEELNFEDSKHFITVHYDGILPDLFREGQGIVANGALMENKDVDASEVLAKHDENYVPKELADSAGQKHEKMRYSKDQLEKN